MGDPLEELPLAVEPTDHREHCRLPVEVIEALGLREGQQVLLRSGEHCALYTVAGTADAVQVDPEGRDRLDASIGERPERINDECLLVTDQCVAQTATRRPAKLDRGEASRVHCQD